MGIGRAIAERALAEGCHLVIGDLKQENLDKVAAEMSDLGHAGKIITVKMDASKLEDNQRLLDVTLAEFGEVNLFFANAGVGGGPTASSVLNADFEKWQWVESVNFWGVLYGCKLFGNAMVEEAKKRNAAGGKSYEGHIVTTSSMAGIVHGILGAYSTSKHSVVALTEGLMREFQAMDLYPSTLGASVLCPAFVNTNIFNQGKYEQARTKNNAASGGLDFMQVKEMSAEEEKAGEEAFSKMPGSIPPSQAAATVFESISKQELYILTHPTEAKMAVEGRAKTILNRTAPALVPSAIHKARRKLGQQEKEAMTVPKSRL